MRLTYYSSHIMVLMGIVSCLVAIRADLIADKLPDASDQGWHFSIIRVESVDVTKRDYLENSRNVAKWMITTELINNSGKDRCLLAVPLYGAAACNVGQDLNDKVDSGIFLSGSHLPLRSKQSDFVVIPPKGRLVSAHKLYARRDPAGTFYTLFGSFVRNENVPEELKTANFATEWLLRKSPVGDEFKIAITLTSKQFEDIRTILGDENAKFWEGSIQSEPISIRTLAPVNWSRAPEAKGDLK